MNKIASFTVNHLNLLPGVYVSRRDYIGSEVVTTFDHARPEFHPPIELNISLSATRYENASVPAL